MPFEVLQVSQFSPSVSRGLQDRFSVHRWFEIPDQERWLHERGAEIRGIVTAGNMGVTNELVARLPNLGIIAISGVGFDKVDLEFARTRGIRVTNTPDVVTDDVADLALGLIISVLRGIPAAHRHVAEGRWPASPMPLGRSVSGRRFGIIGLGRIGRAIAARLSVIGHVSYSAPAPKNSPYPYVADLHQLARDSDVLILACSANASTYHLIGRSILDALGPDGVLINVGRGSLVDESELIAALAQKRIAATGLDVFEDEPNVPQALSALPNVVLTPHIGTATRETRENMGRMMLASLGAFANGAPLPNALV